MSKEIVLIMGYPCSGKSTVVKGYVQDGYVRLNRDDAGGSLDQLNVILEERIKAGYSTKFVLDNTYGKKDQRAAVIDIAKRHGFDVVCVWMQTSIEDAQFNSSWRILNEFPDAEPNVILGPSGSKKYPSTDNVPAIALFAYKKALEKPTKEEGLKAIIKQPFERKMPSEYVNKALLLDYDGTLRTTDNPLKYPVTPDEISILPNRSETLQHYKDAGYLLLGVSNQSGVEKGEISAEAVKECFDRTNELLGHNIDYQYCPHHSFPIRCYCRKPLFGLGVYFVLKYKLNPSQCIVVGDQKTDQTFSERGGMQFQWAKDFFNDKTTEGNK